MRKSTGIAAGLAALVCLGAGTAQAEVLVNQDGATVANVRSDRYAPVPPSDSNNDTVAADDFTVPAGQVWTTSTVTAFGTFDLSDGLNTPPPPPPAELNIRIYANATGPYALTGEAPFLDDFPGAVIYQADAVTATLSGQPAEANYTVNLPNAPVLPAGHYWISVQQNRAQYYDNGGHPFRQQWLWQVVASHFDAGDSLLKQQNNNHLSPDQGCPAPPTGWYYALGCDDGLPQPMGGVRGGPPPPNARMLISGTRGSPNTPGGNTTAATKKCGKKKRLKHGKCVKKKSKAKKVDPGFTG
jgi:hypothetical protein